MVGGCEVSPCVLGPHKQVAETHERVVCTVALGKVTEPAISPVTVTNVPGGTVAESRSLCRARRLNICFALLCCDLDLAAWWLSACDQAKKRLNMIEQQQRGVLEGSVSV